MTHNNYMGKIDEDFTKTTISNYDSPKIIATQFNCLKSELDNIRKSLDISHKIANDERLLKYLIGNLADKYFTVEYFNPEDIKKDLTN